MVVEHFFRDPRTLLYKMAIGRLANMKFPLREFERIFGHDHRTVTSWAQGLKGLDPAQFLRIYSGQGALPKVDAVLECFVRTKYRELRGEARDFRVRIKAEVKARFSRDLSEESLRRVFRKEDIESADRAAAEQREPSPLASVTAAPGSVAGESALDDVSVVPVPAAVEPPITALSPAATVAEVTTAPLAAPAPIAEVASVALVLSPEPPQVKLLTSRENGGATTAISSTELPPSRNHAPALPGLPLSGYLGKRLHR